MDKDCDGKECPHKAIADVRDTTPLAVETVADHGYATGDQVKVSGISMADHRQRHVDHHRAPAPRSFTPGRLRARRPPQGFLATGLRPGQPAPSRDFIPGHVVRISDVPELHRHPDRRAAR